jgi:hypothetical protein
MQATPWLECREMQGYCHLNAVLEVVAVVALGH